MKPYLNLLAVALVLGLAGCASEYTESEAPKNLTLDNEIGRAHV